MLTGSSVNAFIIRINVEGEDISAVRRDERRRMKTVTLTTYLTPS